MSIKLARTQYNPAIGFVPESPANQVGTAKSFCAAANRILERSGGNVFGAYRRIAEKRRNQKNNKD
jgi:hypothetical protein